MFVLQQVSWRMWKNMQKMQGKEYADEKQQETGFAVVQLYFRQWILQCWKKRQWSLLLQTHDEGKKRLISARGSPDTTICKYCGKTITSQFVNRMYCDYTCCRLFLYYMKSLKKPNKKFTKHEETNTIFRKYLTNMVEEMGEPLLQYKHWEMHLRNNPIPEKLKSAIENSEPLEQGITV